MKTIGSWIKSTVQQVLDPDREERTQEVAAQLYSKLKEQRQKFSISEFANQLNYTERDLERAKRKVYQAFLEQAWKDGKVSQEELATLSWIGECLHIPAKEATELQHKAARIRFASALSKAMDDGYLDDSEARFLGQIAGSVGLSLTDFVRTYFRTEGEDFLRGVFAACTEGGALAEDVWARLLQTTQRLGISKKELAIAILPQAERFIEHVLADAKSDGELSEPEEAHLEKLCKTLGLPNSSRSYVQQSIASLRSIRLARHGKLPVERAPVGISVRSGEITHLHVPASWYQLRILKSGEHWDKHNGTLTITDNRLIFSSETKSFDVRFGRIVQHSGHTGVIRLQRAEKPESVIRVEEDEPLAYAILEGAIALSNQTRIAKQDGASSRYIPRDVRQRVWQRYGGRCAECGDSHYIEFDHVIPVAKGGSNSDANVQLLCRGCNLKKSDFI